MVNKIRSICLTWKLISCFLIRKHVASVVMRFQENRIYVQRTVNMQGLKHSGSIHGAGAITETFMWEELWYILNIMYLKSADVH